MNFSATDLDVAHDDAHGVDLLTERKIHGKVHQFVKIATGITVAAGTALYDSTTAGEVTTVAAGNTFRGVSLVAATAAQFIWAVTRGKTITVHKEGYATTVGGQVLGSITASGLCAVAISSMAITGRLLGYWESVTSAGSTSAPATLY